MDETLNTTLEELDPEKRSQIAKFELDELIIKMKRIENTEETIKTLYEYNKSKLKRDYEDKLYNLEEKRSQINQRIEFLMGQLRSEDVRETNTQTKLSLLHGDIVQTKAYRDFEANKDELLKLAEEKGLDEYIKIKEEKSFKWGEYKKRLSIVDDRIVDTETGEIIDLGDALKIKEIESKITIK